MPTSPLVVCPLALAALALVAAPLAAAPSPAAPTARAGTEASTMRLRHYRMSGRVRPLLIWMGKDDVGLARVEWRVDGAGRRGYDLLIGTDPGKAPRGLNRWGFVSEQATDVGGDLLALMKLT